MNAWDRTGEVGKKIKSFAKAIQGPKQDFADFLQRLTSVVNIIIPDLEARWIIETLAFENGNSQCKRVISLLKVRLAPLEE